MIALIFCLFISCVYAGEWWTLPRTEDEKFIYYVGVADGSKEHFSQTQDLATNRAMSEMIREHFGVSMQISETLIEELTGDSFQVVTRQSSAPLFLKGTSIVKTFEKDLGKSSRVYIQLRVDKRRIQESVENHRMGNVENTLNSYGESSSAAVNFKVRTNPSGAYIGLFHLDQRYAIHGQGDASFNIPRGRYKMVITLPGYADLTKEVLIQSEFREEYLLLEQLYSTLKLDIYPSNAALTLNGVKQTNLNLKLAVGKTYKIGISHPDYLSSEEEYVASYEEEIKKTVYLTPRNSTISLEVYPKDAQVSIDGRYVSGSLERIITAPGKRVLQVSHHQFKTYTETLSIEPNRHYQHKVVRLKKEAKRVVVSHSEPDFSMKLEYTPFLGDRGLLLPLGFFVRWQFVSLGAGIGYSYSKDDKSSMGEAYAEEKSFTDQYATVRLLLPTFYQFQLMASATVGSTKRTEKIPLEKTSIEKKESFTGIGGGLRLHLNQNWSIQVEYFQLQKENKNRVVIGLGYEF